MVLPPAGDVSVWRGGTEAERARCDEGEDGEDREDDADAVGRQHPSVLDVHPHLPWRRQRRHDRKPGTLTARRHGADDWGNLRIGLVARGTLYM